VSDTCCGPGDGRHHPASVADITSVPAGGGPTPSSLIDVAASTYRMGDDSVWAYPGDGEAPIHDVELDAFRIDRFAVTNDAFAAFVDATGWQTDAERFGWSFVFAGFLPEDFPDTRAVVGAEWWRQVYGTEWRHPEGPDSDLDGRDNHPVVHVSWNDAAAYCRWTGTRLPTEAEWECAARGGLVGVAFPWGNDLEPGGEHRMNVFQGQFPGGNTGADGYLATAPVDAFAPNGFGLHNVTGNVWEWCEDWLDLGSYSYLCHLSYCRRYRVSARFGSEPESSAGHTGFRVAADA
jgi:sulfatase modifying factor 1